ncbi:MAG TPA: CaiB/BaiF CoA-transferase family protein [Burkholderiales bacterium]|nr:CaiB/BaiF CoA-transferase family protein [Burkholderiales bacterium]
MNWLPLAGIKVADFSVLIPGPFTTAILADLGADVIKVEPPRGDSGRSLLPAVFHAINRNKRSLALDLKHAEAKPVVERLARWADVVIESNRPGVSARLGIDYAGLSALNPGLIYCSLSGFGQNGPWRDRPGHDIGYVGASGGLSYPGSWLGKPARSSIPIADMQGGSFGTIAILAALHARGRSGKGTQLDLSLYEAGLFCAALRHGIAEHTDPRAHIWPVNDLFETADGSVLILGIVEQHFWDNFRAAVKEMEPAVMDPRFDTDPSRRKHGDELSRLLKRLFLNKTARQWHDLLEPLDVPLELPLTPTEASRTEYAKAREDVAEVDGQRHVLFPLWANGRRGGKIRRATPALNADGAAVLQELGFAQDEVQRILGSAAAAK